jgi:hypothetical protein
MMTGKILEVNISNKGYFSVCLYKNKKCKKLLIHRLVAIAFIENPDDKIDVDHIDGNRKNNNVMNLRWATRSENNMNQKLRKDNHSGVKGVHWNAKLQKWRAQITMDCIPVYLGCYDDLQEAKQARLDKATEFFGEFKNICEV